MKKRIIKRVGHEFDIYEDGRRYGMGPGYMVQLDESGRVIDLIDFGTWNLGRWTVWDGDLEPGTLFKVFKLPSPPLPPYWHCEFS